MESSSYPQCADARRADARIRAYTGEGMFTDDPLDRFGTKAGCTSLSCNPLCSAICRNGLERHVAMNGSHGATSVAEPLQAYQGWDVYLHQGALRNSWKGFRRQRTGRMT